MTATAMLELLHDTELLIATPDESNVTAVAWAWCGIVSAVESMSTCTRAAIAFDTKTGILPVTPSIEATIHAEPADTPTTTPFDDTAATDGSVEDHETAAPIMTFPERSRTMAVACAVLVGVSDVGRTVTDTCAALLCPCPCPPCLDASASGETPALEESEQLCVVNRTR